MGKVLVITSGKGGVGKTTVSANIGAGLARQGKSVVNSISLKEGEAEFLRRASLMRWS